MNLEIAQRLIELRKKHGYSQDALADKLGVSRQAISKWERVEAAPDTDNLIALAELYDVSLDELLGRNVAGKTDTADKIDAEEAESEPNASGINIDSDDGKVHVGFDGIHIESNNKEKVNISWNGLGDKIKSAVKDGVTVNVNGENGATHAHVHREHDHDHEKLAWGKLEGVLFIAAVIAYVLVGSLCDLWHPGWLIILLPPIVASFFNFEKFKANFPLLVTVAYLFMGCCFKLWHPGWLIFLAVPVFYIVLDCFKKKKQ